ncbi:MAG TPA: hypothetical protein DDZ51_27970 [Planctomycetaceae bacterium]|nr:hypothetical protein [Planctomycetaceae bacterium]
MIRKSFSIAALAGMLALSVGCGGDGGPVPVPVTGQVLYQGKPVEDARITFHGRTDAGGRSASGKTDGQGNFSLTTFKSGDGAVPGDYTISISKTAESAKPLDTAVDPDSGEYGADYGAMMAAAASGPALKKLQPGVLPEKYNSPATTDLQRSVVADQKNEFTIELE